MPKSKVEPLSLEQPPMRVEYIPLSKLVKWPRNPKQHDLPSITASMNRFGYTVPILIDERSGWMTAGHGRVEALELQKAEGKAPPERVIALGDEWYVPVLRGVRFNSDAEAEAYGLADNRITMIGGIDEPTLLDVLQDLEAGPGLDGTGFAKHDLDDLRRMLTPPTLDQLATEFGETPAETAFWPVIRLQVAPETYELYLTVVDQFPGEKEPDKFEAMLLAAQRSLLMEPGPTSDEVA